MTVVGTDRGTTFSWQHESDGSRGDKKDDFSFQTENKDGYFRGGQ